MVVEIVKSTHFSVGDEEVDCENVDFAVVFDNV